jgi:AbrB family looped-hinge helix DNA binding protein
MPTVTVSPKYQVVIPKEVRETMGIEPGQEMAMMVYQERILLIPILPMEELRGFAKGIDTTIERDPDRL